jgi:hypothetical protein
MNNPEVTNIGNSYAVLAHKEKNRRAYLYKPYRKEGELESMLILIEFKMAEKNTHAHAQLLIDAGWEHIRLGMYKRIIALRESVFKSMQTAYKEQEAAHELWTTFLINYKFQ